MDARTPQDRLLRANDSTRALLARLWREDVRHHRGRLLLVLALTAIMAGTTALYPVLIDHAGNVNRRLADGTTPATPPEALLVLARYQNLYLKLTTHNVHDLPPGFLERVVQTFGASRVAWGSNYPAAKGKLSALLAKARNALASLKEQERDWIFVRTARSVYG